MTEPASPPASAPAMHLPDVRVPAVWTLGGLAAGLIVGLLMAGAGAPPLATMRVRKTLPSPASASLTPA